MSESHEFLEFPYLSSHQRSTRPLTLNNNCKPDPNPGPKPIRFPCKVVKLRERRLGLGWGLELGPYDRQTDSLFPFHFIVLFQATRPIQTRQRLYNKTENQYKAQKTHKHIYTTRSDFTNALLLALQRATSDFLALIIKVSKLGKPVKSNVLVTL